MSELPARDELLADRQALNRLMADEPDERTNANFARRDAIDRALQRDAQRVASIDATPPTSSIDQVRCQGPGCFVDFEPSRKDQRFHTEACKKRAQRARAGADTRFRPTPPSNHPGNREKGTNRRIGMRGFEADFGPSLQIGDSGAQRA